MKGGKAIAIIGIAFFLYLAGYTGLALIFLIIGLLALVIPSKKGKEKKEEGIVVPIKTAPPYQIPEEIEIKVKEKEVKKSRYEQASEAFGNLIKGIIKLFGD